MPKRRLDVEGDHRYLEKYYRCQCCNKVKHRVEFYRCATNDVDLVEKFSVICSDCRKHKGSLSKGLKPLTWGADENITRPSFIDWMEKNIKK